MKVVSPEITTGVGGSTPSGWESIVVGGRGRPTVINNYCEGTVNGNEIDTDAEITNSYGKTNGNYYKGKGGKTPEEIAAALNGAAGGDENINFDVVNGEVIFGKVNKEKVCETPNNLSISNIDGVYTAIWHNPGADDTMEEGEWHLRLTGGNDVDYYSTINDTTISSPLPPSPNPYVFTVYTYCPLDNSDSIISQEVSATFGVACPIPTNLQVTDLSYNSFVATWQSNADCQLTVNENAYTISQSNSMSQMITGLTPETEYSVSVKAKCGGDYLEEITTIATTTKIPAPTNLMVSTVWNETSGSATMTWELPEGFLFEVETENNPEMSQQVISDAQYSISNLEPGSYTAKVRATKEINSTIYYSDWVEVPYTISAIPAPSNPQITFTPQQDGKVEVKVDKENNTIWLIQNEIAKLFNLDRTWIGRSLKKELKKQYPKIRYRVTNCTTNESLQRVYNRRKGLIYISTKECYKTVSVRAESVFIEKKSKIITASPWVPWSR